MRDVHYTTARVAAQLLASLPTDASPKRIVDFAAGDGALLAAAKLRFPKGAIYYNDIDSQVAANVARREPEWIVSSSDFLNPRASAAARYSRAGGGFDLVLLNPPFSQRGLRPRRVSVGATQLECSVALAFVLRALEFLNSGGVLLAVLPLGCFDRRMDSAAWRFLRNRFDLTHLLQLDCFAFPSARARTKLVSICRAHDDRTHSEPLVKREPRLPLVVRGGYPMHLAKVRSRAQVQWPLVHTTDLKSGGVASSGLRVASGRVIDGPAVLIPRVGAIRREKVAVLNSTARVVLSDCVFAVLCDSEPSAHSLRNQILKDWEIFEMLFGGTGAPYTTKSKLQTYLARCEQSGTRACSNRKTRVRVQFS